jgi:hypothetical protein
MTTASNPTLVAAAPSLISALQAFQAFEADMGANPLLWAANYPGAKLKLLGELALQLPALATAEGGELESVITATTSSWITKLQAAIASAPSAVAAPAVAPVASASTHG